MSPLAERRLHLLAEDLPLGDEESADEMMGSSSEAASASHPGTTRISRDIQDKRRARQVMSLSPLKRRPGSGVYRSSSWWRSCCGTKPGRSVSSKANTNHAFGLSRPQTTAL